VFFGVAEKITQGLWPKADAYAMNIGVVMRYILGASVITSGCILFQARAVEDQSSVRKILLGSAVGLAVVFATLAWIRVTGNTLVPLPPIVMVAVLSGLCFWSAFKAKSG
jgi:hypothetical protein